MKPSVGRIVHYMSYGTPGGEYGKECRAAIITEVGEIEMTEHGPGDESVTRPCVGLAVLNPSGMFFNRAVVEDDGQAGGTWHWPERVEE